MSDRDLLVPGTSGCKLVANGNDIGWPALLTAEAWLAGTTGISVHFEQLGLSFSADEIRALLSMEFGDPQSAHPTKTSLQPGTSMAPGPLLRAVYNQFTDFDTFLYDWRSDLRDTGRLLLEKLKNRPASGPWRIAAHSQGGLAVVVASKLCAAENNDDDTAFSKLVSHVAFIATPFHGNVTAALAILRGEDLTPAFADTFKSVVRTWPSIHQMLPVWPGSVRAPGANGAADPRNLMDDTVWAGEGLDPDMLRRARDTRAAFLRNPISRMRGVTLRAIFSQAWATDNHLVLDGGRLTAADPSWGEDGDTLVPKEAVLAMSSDVERGRFLFLGGQQDTMKHFALGIDPVVVPEVRGLFGQ